MLKFLFSIFFLILFNLANISAQVDTLIDLGTYKLHFKIIKGEGTPILFESGGGLDARAWDSISTVLHGKLNATMISYDRQGFGQSSIDTTDYTILNEIKGLELALERLGYGAERKLLVSHSLGAFYSRLYASRNPELVKGMVMLDPRIPSYADMRFARNIAAKLDRNEFSKEETALYYVLTAMERNSNFVRKRNIPSPIPILDLMAEEGPFDTEEENERFKSSQRNFISHRKNARLVFVKGSSHNIAQDNPEIVIAEILNFYNKNSK